MDIQLRKMSTHHIIRSNPSNNTCPEAYTDWAWSCYNKFLLLGKGIISTAVELVIFVFVSSTRWYS